MAASVVLKSVVACITVLATCLAVLNVCDSGYSTQSRRFEPGHCTLRRLTAPQARQCLNHKRLVFVSLLCHFDCWVIYD